MAWTVREWGELLSLSKAYIYRLLKRGVISSVKSGTRRLITTPPSEYLAHLAADDTKYGPRGRPVK